MVKSRLGENNTMIPPPPTEVLMTKTQMRDQDALRQEEAYEPLEQVSLDSAKPDNTVKIGTMMASSERQQLK